LSSSTKTGTSSGQSSTIFGCHFGLGCRTAFLRGGRRL
jgi:hypothetical protein